MKAGQWSLISAVIAPARETAVSIFVISRSRMEDVDTVRRVAVVITFVKPVELSLVIKSHVLAFASSMFKLKSAPQFN